MLHATCDSRARAFVSGCEYAKRTSRDLVVSGAIVDRVTLPPGVTAARCGELALRGKEAPVVAYGLAGSMNPRM